MGEIGLAKVEDTPVNGHATIGISSNWAYDHNADVTKHRPVFVDRGDPAAFDFVHGTLTIDNTWHDLSLASIVPAGAIAVALYISIWSDAVNTVIAFRKKGNSNEFNLSKHITQVANIYNFSDLMVIPDSNRIIQYKGASGGNQEIDITVKGWWI